MNEQGQTKADKNKENGVGEKSDPYLGQYDTDILMIWRA
jgi:hypothetical protein